MRRREFIALLGGASVGWPDIAHTQDARRPRRIGVLLGLAESDPEANVIVGSFRDKLMQLGWLDVRDLRFDIRFAGDDGGRIRNFALELVGAAPDVIFGGSQPVLDAMRDATRTIPLVFIQITDPVGLGYAKSLARPGGNLTGIANYVSMSGKLLEILREIMPTVTTVAVMLNENNASNIANYRSIVRRRATV